jgi:uncharacterized protein (DUF58 family)
VSGAARRHRRRGAVGRMRPQRAVVPFSVTVVVLLGWGVVAHDSGSGWVQVLGEAVGATVVVGLFGPAVALARTRVECRASPADGRAGSPIELTVVATQRIRVRAVDPPGPVGFVGPGPDRGAPETVTVVARRHGVLESVTLEVESAAPFGLLWWSKRVVVALATPVHVAPRLGHPRPVRPLADDGAGDGARRVPALIGEARGARPYRPGDSRQWVHWPATAHTGTLMVREMEGPVRVPATVTVTLPADLDAAEAVAEDGYATVVALLAKGTAVVLVTTERTGVVADAVADRRSAGRRLARAIGTPAAGGGGPSGDPGGEPGGVAVDFGGGAGARWRR